MTQIFLSSPSWGTFCPNNTKGTVIFFANGVDNDPRKAITSREKLEMELRKFLAQNPLKTGCVKGFDLSYNHNEFFLLDYFESVRQLTSLGDTAFWRTWFKPILSSSAVSKIFVDLLLSVDLASYAVDSDLREHASQYKNEITTKGNSVLVVAHSQGNLYANQSYEFLSFQEQETFGIVAVATPSSFIGGTIPGNEPYTTLKEDPIQFVPGALEPNSSNGPCGTPKNCHSFVASYMMGINSDSELHIMLNIATVISNFSTPPPEPEPADWNEDFEELNLGEIGGQGHWVLFAGDGDVDDSQAFTGSQSLRLDNDGTRLLMPGGFLADFGSMVTSYLRISTISSGARGVMYFNDHQDVASPVTLSCHLGHLDVPGYIAFNNEALKEVAENTWYKLDVQFDYSANRCRGRVDNEGWSAWQDQNVIVGRALHVAFIGSVGFAQFSIHDVWFDDISVSGPAMLK